jgi:hypothetical protein
MLHGVLGGIDVVPAVAWAVRDGTSALRHARMRQAQ